MTRRPSRLTGTQLTDERIDANVIAEGRPSPMTAQGGEQAALREQSLAGVDRVVAHGLEASAGAGSRAPALDRDPNCLGLLAGELVR